MQEFDPTLVDPVAAERHARDVATAFEAETARPSDAPSHGHTAREQIEKAAADGDIEAKHLLETRTDAQWEELERRRLEGIGEPAAAEENRRLVNKWILGPILGPLLFLLLRSALLGLVPSGDGTADAETKRWQSAMNNILYETEYRTASSDSNYARAQVVWRDPDGVISPNQGSLWARDYPDARVSGGRAPTRLGLIPIGTEVKNVLLLDGEENGTSARKKYAVFYCSDIQDGYEASDAMLRLNEFCVLPARRALSLGRC